MVKLPQRGDLNETNRQIRAANSARYERPETVATYTADPYHALRLSLAADLLIGALSTGAKGPVMEVGAGGPTFLTRLVQRGVMVLAGDIELEAARAVRPTPAVVLDASRTLPLRDESLAGLFLGELIEHVFDTRGLLDECHRVLRPGGSLVLTTPNLAGLQDRIGFLFGRSPRHVDALHDYLHLHIRPFTKSSLLAALGQHGFAPFAVHGNYVVFRGKNKRRVQLRWPARLFPGLGGSLVIAARRVEKL